MTPVELQAQILVMHWDGGARGDDLAPAVDDLRAAVLESTPSLHSPLRLCHCRGGDLHDENRRLLAENRRLRALVGAAP